MTNVHDIALEKALELGLPCFPCNADKTPRCPRPGFHRATANPNELRALWRAYPGVRVGVPMNKESGLFCLDIDSAKYPTAKDWFERHFHLMPETRIHKTESGGLHYLFKHRDGCGSGNSKIHKGVDTKGDNTGYIIWWPCHVADGHYLIEPAPVPDWLAELVNPPAPARAPQTVYRVGSAGGGNPAKRLEAVLAKVAGAREGERNSLLYWAACRINEMINECELDEGGAETAVAVLAKIGEDIGLERRAVRLSIESALK